MIGPRGNSPPKAVRSSGGHGGRSPRGFGYQRVYGTDERPIDVLAEVRSGDVVLVPHGWHGPAMAAPGYDLYYLNVMAGPGSAPTIGPGSSATTRPTAGCATPGRPSRSTPDSPLEVLSDERDPPVRDRRDGPTHRGPGRRALPCQPVERARRRTAEALRRLLRHLRPRQRRRHRPGAAAERARRRPGAPPLRARPQRAGDGAHVGRLRPPEGPPPDVGLHRLGRPRLDQHAHRCGPRDHQPAPGPPPAVGHLRDARQLAGAPGARGAVCR